MQTALNDDDGSDDEKVHRFDLNEIPSDSSEQGSDNEAEGSGLLDQSVEEENEVGYVRKRTFSIEIGNMSEDMKKQRG